MYILAVGSCLLISLMHCNTKTTYLLHSYLSSEQDMMPASMPSASSPSKPQTFLAPSPTPSRAVSPRTSYTALHHSRVNFSNRVGPASSTTSLCSAVFNLVQDDTIVNSSQLLEPAAFAVAQKAAQTSHSTQEQKRITEYKVRPINVLHVCKLR